MCAICGKAVLYSLLYLVLFFMHARKRFRHCIALLKPIDAPHQNIKLFLTQMVVLFHHMTYFVEKLSCIATVPCSLFLYTLENALDIIYPRFSC